MKHWVITGENRYKWMWMGTLGLRGHGGHRNKASRRCSWSCRSGFGSHDRGNFPGHHVLGDEANMVKDGWLWVCIGLGGCSCMHKQLAKQKQGKKRQKWVSSAHFRIHDHGQKMQHVGKDGLCAQRGSRGGIKGNQRARSTLQCIKANEKQENKQGSKRKRQNQDAQIW